MSAENTDKFKKVAQNTGWQLDASGISDSIIDNFGLITASGQPTDTAVLVTVDRVDGGGNKTAAKMERIIGVVSGNRLINCIRGVDGTAQPHAGSAVVEVLISAKNINDLMDGILIEHNQDGTHKVNLTAEHNANGTHKLYMKYLGEMTIGSNGNTSSSSYVDVATLTVTMPAAGDLIMHGSTFWQDLSTGTGDDFYYTLELDGTTQEGNGSFRSASQYNGLNVGVYAKFTGLSAGDHTLKLKAKVGTHTLQWKSGLCHIGFFALIGM